MKTFAAIFLLTPLFAFSQTPYLPVSSAGEAYFLSARTNIQMPDRTDPSFIDDSLILTVKGELTTGSGPYNSLAINSMARGSMEQICKGASWLGDTMFFSQNKAIFLNFNRDSIYIDLDLSLGQTADLFITDTGSFKITLESLQKENYLGVDDSVKTFRIQYKDLNGMDASHIFNGKTIRIGKELGFLQTYDLYYFPSDSASKVLVGKTVPDIGVSNLTSADFYNFNAGDEFHYQGEARFDPANYSYWWRTRSFLDKTTRTEKQFTENYSFSQKTETYSHDTLNSAMYDQSLDNPSLFYSDELGIVLFLVDNGELIKRTWGAFQPESTGCRRTIIFGGYIPSQTTFKVGIGEVLTCCGTEYEELVYYKKGDVEWGEPLNMGVITFTGNSLKKDYKPRIFPNPASDQLFIETPEEAEVVILNGIGEIVAKTTLTSDKVMDISYLLPGMYHVVWTGMNFSTHQKLLIK